MPRVHIYHERARRQSQAEAEQFVRDRLREIQFQARLHVVLGPYTTGKLALSIKARGPFMQFGRVGGSVGSDLNYAASVEGGAGLYGPRRSKYRIYPRHPNGRLKFYWRRIGKNVRLPSVNHPGQKPKHYLLKAAESVARRNNMLLVIHEL